MGEHQTEDRIRQLARPIDLCDGIAKAIEPHDPRISIQFAGAPVVTERIQQTDISRSDLNELSQLFHLIGITQKLLIWSCWGRVTESIASAIHEANATAFEFRVINSGR